MARDRDVAKAKRFNVYFVIAFSIYEAIILIMKGVIYLSDREWWTANKVSAT